MSARLASRVIDGNGYIVDPRVRANYARICRDCRWSAVDHSQSAEAYLRLVLRIERYFGPRNDNEAEEIGI